MHIWLGLYLVGVAIAIVVLYDRDDGFWPLVLAFLWPVLTAFGLLGFATGSIAIGLSRLKPNRPCTKCDGFGAHLIVASNKAIDAECDDCGGSGRHTPRKRERDLLNG